jgi:P4 family phage/plasmid primase-like protien
MTNISAPRVHVNEIVDPWLDEPANNNPVSPLHQVALDWAACNVPVFPCLPRSKKPAVAGGFHAATTNREQIGAWWKTWPDANPAFEPEANGLAVIDPEFDAAPNWANGHPLPATFTVKTPRGGKHLYFEGSLPSTMARLAKRVDTRGKGGYVLLPGCIVFDEETGTTGTYTIEHDVDYAPLPAWLVQWGEAHASRERKEASVATGKPVTEEHLRKLLAYIDPDAPRDDWRDTVAAIHATPLVDDPGASKRRQLAHEYSEGKLDRLGRYKDKLPAKYTDAAAVDAVFDTMPPCEGGVRYGTLFAMAQAGGYEGGPAQESSAETFKNYKPDQVLVQKAAGKTVDGEIEKVVAGSDDDLALGFTSVHGQRVRYVAEWNRWLAFDGRRWVEVKEPFIWNLVRPLLREYANRMGGDSANARRKITSKNTIANVASLARGDVLARAGQWDSDPWLLNTPAGLVDLRTGVLQASDRNAYCTKMTGVAPDASEHPLWSKFLRVVTAGDIELQQYLQRLVGYSLTGLTVEHILAFLYGTGANGKGVFLGTLNGILADYARVAPVDTFTETKGERHPTDMAMLQGARLVSAQETDAGRYWAEAKVKALTGGDKIAARFMRGDFFEYIPNFKLVIAGNHKPRLHNVDEAIRRRLHLVPFTVTIPEKDRDPELPEKLRQEWPAILRWAIEGCLDWQTFGLAPTAAVLDTTTDYFIAQDPLARWIEAKCVQEPGAWASHQALYESFCSHERIEGNNFPIGPKNFTQRMESQRFKPKRGDGRDRSRGFCGIALRR